MPYPSTRSGTVVAAVRQGIALAGALLAAQVVDPGDALGTNWFNQDYVEDGIIGHRLDVLQPPTGSPPYPVVVFIYGSAWQCNSCKNAVTHVLPSLLGGGFAVATINHRASSDAIYPAQIQDCKAAIRFLRANATTYGLDPNRIGVTGSSSGGHLVSLLGTSGGVTTHTVGDVTMDIEGSLGAHTDVSSSVQAVCDWYGPTDFLIMNTCGSKIDHDAPDSPESLLIGGPIQAHPNECALANPITYVDPSDPPFRMFHGDSDPAVPQCQSDSLHAALAAAGVPVEYTVVPGAGHGWDDATEQVLMVEFFQDVLADVSHVPDGGTDDSFPDIASSNDDGAHLQLDAHPNPVLESTVLSLDLPEPEAVRIQIHDCAGRVVRTLVSDARRAGTHSIRWDGRDDDGSRVPSGVYFARASALSYSGGTRLIVLE